MAPRTKKPKDIEEQLRQAIRESELTAYKLAQQSGVSAGQIGRFLSGERTLTLTAAGKLATALGLRLATVADQSPVAVVPVAAIQDAAVLAAIQSNQKRNAPARLGDVFKALQASHQALTLGTFHDSIRTLQTAGKVELSPWTQAGYQLKNGEACLIQGAEIMAFVSPG